MIGWDLRWVCCAAVSFRCRAVGPGRGGVAGNRPRSDRRGEAALSAGRPFARSPYDRLTANEQGHVVVDAVVNVLRFGCSWTPARAS